MGFDNECILNIQSLAGEYFCPVCRLLVYPNEALQSQCTHLYCKPCLTYVVSTTRACPYDGYLVTEADSKPLIESNKPLAETIGKISVHCLYHRSGCTWQGSLSDCTSHCSGCAFGNSPVVCNRCGIQIVHRQVQEHAQSCPGVQPQAQQAEGAAETSASGTAATADQSQSVTQAAAVASQAQSSQTTAVTAPGKDLNQQTVSSSQAQAAVPIAEQWYQHQQQYQQYYQQYPGYDPYQQHYQHYYPYQQAVASQYQQHVQVQAPPSTGQHQPQVYMQPQPQLQAQPQPQVQAAVATQPQNQAQNIPAQQVHPAVPPHSQSQSQNYPPGHGQPQPYSQHVQIPQYQQPHPQPQIQQQTQSQVQPQYHPPSQSHSLSQTQPPGQLQHHSQQNQPLNANIQSQTHHASTHAVTGQQSHPQPNTDPQVQIGTSQQYPVHAQPQVLSSIQLQNPVQIQSQLPQQPPLMRPPHSHATIPSQQQPALLPSPGQVQNIPTALQQPIQPHFQQPGQPVHQRPLMQPVQPTFPQQHFQQQLPMPSQLRSKGQSHPFPPQSHAYPQPAKNIALLHGMQHAKSPNPVGRPSMPNQGLQSQLYSQYAGGLVRPMYPGANQQPANQNNMLKTNNQMQLPSEQHSGANSKPPFEKGPSQKEAGLNSVPDTAAKAGETKIEKSEFDMKSMDANQTSTTSKESESTKLQGPDSKTYLSENREPKVKPLIKEGGPESTLRPSSEGKLSEGVAENTKDLIKVGPEKVKHSTLEDKETLDGSLQKMPSLQAAENYGGQGGNLLKDAISGPDEGLQGVSMASAQIHGSQNFTARGTAPGSEVKSLHLRDVQDKSRPQVAGVDENRSLLQSSQLQAGGFVEPSHPISDQGRHQPIPSHFGASTVVQRPGAPPLSQFPLPGPPHQTQGLVPHFRPQRPVPEHIQPPSLYGPAHPSSELQSVIPQGPYNHRHSLDLPHVSASRTSQGDSVGLGGPTPHGPEIFPNQRPNYMDGRGLDSHFPGSLERRTHAQPSGIHPNIMRMNGSMGFDSSFAIGSRDERLPVQNERFNPFPPGPDHRISDQAEFENDLKQFPGPFNRGPHGQKFDTGLKADPGPGSVPSRFLSPYNGSNDAGERAGGRHEDNFGRIEPTRGHLDFFGPGPAYGRRHMDSLALRSPGREHPGVSSHGFRGPVSDDILGREVHRFGEPFGSLFHESRFSMLPSHLRRAEFESPANIGIGDHLRHDLIGRDGFSSHLHREEHMGNLYGHLHFGEPDGFGARPRHARIREMGGPGSFDSFGGVDRPSHPHFGEPGFRSSFSQHGFPNDGDIYTGDLAFDKSRKRKPPTMGWCRICKVDCETVEGLDLHSQTREHQKMAMDMVLTIKQNAKKQKLTSADQSSLGDASKPRDTSSEAVAKMN
ncbi:Cdk-activating kinase assembly factor [Trema orientale]|uniref:Cdk-activating kinase assembly factor n=1 Tax=Trema orientale TaxID=63057 RepID=A0A2P5E5V2_TREOI|nr:Cdk-activating kinase assembly factor [Trema orientale]